MVGMGMALTAAAALTAVSPALAPAVTAEELSRRQEICYTLATAPMYAMKIADCLSAARASDGQFTADICRFLAETGQLEEFGYPSSEACLRSALAR